MLKLQNSFIALMLLFNCSTPEKSMRQEQIEPPVLEVKIPEEASGTIAFENVNVVPMTSASVLSNQTVLVRAGRIVEIGAAARVVLPDSAIRIECANRLYLMPGLADMHVHMFDPNELLLYLANGVTTVRNLHGLGSHLAWRTSLQRGELLGPRLYTSGPIVDGNQPARATNRVIRTAAEARSVVAQQKQAGYDFLKIYDNVPRALYEVLAEEARLKNLPMVGHIPTPVGINGLLEVKGQKGIEHVEEFLPFYNDGRVTSGVVEMAQALAAAQVWVVPTMVVHENAGQQHENWPALLARAEMRFMNPQTMTEWGWIPTGEGRARTPAGVERYRRTMSFFQNTLVPELHRAGVKLLLGTDAPVAAIVPGFAVMSELRAFVQSGLSPYQTLEIATKNAATFVNAEHEFGTVEVGKAADLLLLAGNPLLDIENVAQRAGVMVRGRWLSEKKMKEKLEELAKSYGN